MLLLIRKTLLSSMGQVKGRGKMTSHKIMRSFDGRFCDKR